MQAKYLIIIVIVVSAIFAGLLIKNLVRINKIRLLSNKGELEGKICLYEGKRGIIQKYVIDKRYGRLDERHKVVTIKRDGRVIENVFLWNIYKVI